VNGVSVKSERKNVLVRRSAVVKWMMGTLLVGVQERSANLMTIKLRTIGCPVLI